VDVLVDRVIMPPIGLAIAGVDFSGLKMILKSAVDGKGEVSIGYGEFIQPGFNFFIIALAVFIMVKSLNSMKRERPPIEKLVTPVADDIVLLREIRDLLKKK
jgi:large conductance mechanosensitive channel